MDPLLSTPAMAKRLSKRDRPKWDQPEYVCPFCPDIEPFKSHEGQRRDRHLREVHRQIVVWNCPYCLMRKHSHHLDDLRSHMWAVHWRGQSLYAPKASLERLDWREEREERRHHTDTDPDRNRTRRGEKRSRYPQGRTPPWKVVKKDPSPVTCFLRLLRREPRATFQPATPYA